MNAVMERPTAGTVIENVLVNGDLGQLSPEQRVQYYDKVCRSLGLNPLTKPFDYLKLNGRLVLYAKRDCTDQLRSIHKISVTEMTETEREGVIIVTAKVQDGEGRTDISKGAVAIKGASGENYANLVMKAETKAKRRATLSICGLGFLDELEVETIPQENGAKRPQRTREEIQAHAKHKRNETRDRIPNDLAQIETLHALEKYKAEVLTPDFMATLGTAGFAVEEMVATREAELRTVDEELVDDSLEPEQAGKAEYIRQCHTIIDAFTEEKPLLTWWNSKNEKTFRRQHALTPPEVGSLMTRVMERREEILKAAPNILAAG